MNARQRCLLIAPALLLVASIGGCAVAGAAVSVAGSAVSLGATVGATAVSVAGSAASQVIHTGGAVVEKLVD